MKYIMKIVVILFLVLYPKWINAQINFTSPITQNFPSGELEIIERKIFFDGKEFVIESKTVVNTWHVQKWIVKDYTEMELPIHGLSHFYICDSPDGFYTSYIIIPDVNPIEYIEILQPKQLHFASNHYRFLVD